jgi:2-polyprenyl-3-methyl-5-hydroxy-6-metoxy-1,4-benzoquinol methylase
MDKTIKFWDKQSKKYDKSEEQFEPAFVKILEKTKKYVKKNDVLLDFGCATGSKTFQLAPFVKKVICYDISPKMIDEARKKAKDLNIENADFLSGTIFDKQLSKESYDLIVSYGVIHLLKDNDNVMKRINELLKPGGYFISTTACLKEKMTLRSKIVFSLYMFIKKIGLLQLHLNMYKYSDVIEIVSNDFDIVESENMFHGIHICFIVAKKK